MGQNFAQFRARYLLWLALLVAGGISFEARAEGEPGATSTALCEQNALPEDPYFAPPARNLRYRQLRALVDNAKRFKALTLDDRWNPYHLRNVSFRQASLPKVISDLLGPAATAKPYPDARVVYEAADRPIRIVENPWTRTFYIEQTVKKDKVFLDEHGQPLPDQRIRFVIFQSPNQPGSLTGTLRDDFDLFRSLTALAMEAAGNEEKASRRVADYSHSWQRKTLLEGIERFLGTDPAKLTFWGNSRVFTILNLETGVGIIDNPVGRYYKVVRTFGQAEAPADWDARPALDDVEASKLRFFYGDATEADAPGGPFAQLPPEPLPPTFQGSLEIDADSLHKVQRLFARRALNDRFPLPVRVQALQSLDWKRLTARDRAHFMRLVVDQGRPEQNDSYLGFLDLAWRSLDSRWISVLETWLADLAKINDKWARTLESYTQTTVQHLQNNGEDDRAELLVDPPSSSVGALVPIGENVLEQDVQRALDYFKQHENLDGPPLSHGDYLRLVRLLQPGIEGKPEKEQGEAYENLGILAGRRVSSFQMSELQLLPAPLLRAIMRYHPGPLVLEPYDSWDYDWIVRKLAKVPDGDPKQAQGWLRLLLRSTERTELPSALRPWIERKGDELSEDVRFEVRGILLRRWYGRLEEPRKLDRLELEQLERDLVALAQQDLRFNRQPKVDDQLVRLLRVHVGEEDATKLKEQIEANASNEGLNMKWQMRYN